MGLKVAMVLESDNQNRRLAVKLEEQQKSQAKTWSRPQKSKPSHTDGEATKGRQRLQSDIQTRKIATETEEQYDTRL